METKNKKTEHIMVYMTPKEKENLKVFAKRGGTTLSQYMMYAVNKYLTMKQLVDKEGNIVKREA